MENSVVVSGSPWPMHWRDAERVCVKWQNQANPFTGFTSSGMASQYFDRGKILNQLAVHFDTILFYKKLYFCCNSPFNIVNQFITLKIVIFCLELVFFPSERWFENGQPNTRARLDFPKRDSATRLQFQFITLKYVNLFLQALNSFANG